MYKVLVASSPLAAICRGRLLREMRVYTGGLNDMFFFLEFNGRLVAKSSRTIAPWPKRIAYDQYLRFLSIWFNGFIGISVGVFRKQFSTQSVRSGFAPAASNTGVPAELWRQHGDRKSLTAQARNVKCDTAQLFSLSRAVMHLPTGLAPDVRMCGPGADPRLSRHSLQTTIHLPTWSVCPRERLSGLERKTSFSSRYRLGVHAYRTSLIL